MWGCGVCMCVWCVCVCACVCCVVWCVCVCVLCGVCGGGGGVWWWCDVWCVMCVVRCGVCVCVCVCVCGGTYVDPVLQTQSFRRLAPNSKVYPKQSSAFNLDHFCSPDDPEPLSSAGHHLKSVPKTELSLQSGPLLVPWRPKAGVCLCVVVVVVVVRVWWWWW